MRRLIQRGLARAVACCVYAGFIAVPALADSAGDWEIKSWTTWGGVGPYRGREPDIDLSRLNAYADLLDLGEPERKLLVELREQYTAEYTAAWLVWAEESADLQAKQSLANRLDDWSEYERIDAEGDLAGDRFEDTIGELRRAFFEDVRLLVLDDDPQAWLAIERFDRRRNFFYQERGHNGASAPPDLIDLFGVVEAAAGKAEEDGLDPAIGEDAEAILERYGRELDGLIVEMDAARDRLTGLHRALQIERSSAWDDNADPEVRSAAQERIAEIQRDMIGAALGMRRVQVRLANMTERTRTDLQRVLPERMRPVYDERTASAAAGDGPMGGPSRGQDRLDQMMRQLKGRLTERQQTAIDELLAERDERRTGLLDQRSPSGMGAAMLEDEDEANKYEAVFDGASITIYRTDAEGNTLTGSDDKDNAERIRADRLRRLQRLEQEYVNRMRELLTEEQRLVIANI